MVPATPSPITSTFAGGTPAAPPINVPEPPCAADSCAAPTIAAARPAISDMGASSGSPCLSVSVSNA
jgi:hypothetical protein